MDSGDSNSVTNSQSPCVVTVDSESLTSRTSSTQSNVEEHQSPPVVTGNTTSDGGPSSFLKRSPKKDRGDAAEGGRQRLVCLGLPNLGQTCFMNATLQCLFHLTSFCQDITRQKEHWGLVPSTDLMRHFTDLLTTPESRVKQKKQLLRNLMGRFSGQFTEDEQCDAHKFLTFLISQLSDLGISVQARESTATYLCPVEANLAFEMLSEDLYQVNAAGLTGFTHLSECLACCCHKHLNY
nr:ubiquitin carboxyl-terminal hydrolase 37-like isoform X1 [Paramormyrops kingsleyae]XP_023700164.1 ubiquitin carboxyl-terminal hydrolase 37-like isoform X1 [Paramormyrops kingsleyae]XP_023700165.1 ubiquitin carboxyl-terminal hydrolase 37-like isoform X1 [Paramormyrops kingsleyae]